MFLLSLLLKSIKKYIMYSFMFGHSALFLKYRTFAITARSSVRNNEKVTDLLILKCMVFPKKYETRRKLI